MRLLIRPLAEADLEDSFAWYEGKSPGLVQKFAREIDETFSRIRKNPKAFKIRAVLSGIQIRAAVVDRFPFLIFYHVDPSRKTLVVEAIWHTPRNPFRWKKRIK